MSIPFAHRIPFVHHLGFTLEAFGDGLSELHYAPRPEHLNSLEVVHGGAVMTLLDVTMATAARSVQPQLWVVTVEMKTSFLRPASVAAGSRFVARGTLQHRTRSMAFTEGRLFDAAGELCAMATGTFKYVARREATGPSTN
ncbi:PaaI family thioesterase [Limnohabitans sp.]|jgi:uncharacterized protein (TIGR00369 family)|uniref:PaaI family thioesterase n=1 Tax=Limnohabitans sp. TaxID=1907725 RepID=UPI0038D7C9EE